MTVLHAEPSGVAWPALLELDDTVDAGQASTTQPGPDSAALVKRAVSPVSPRKVFSISLIPQPRK